MRRSLHHRGVTRPIEFAIGIVELLRRSWGVLEAVVLRSSLPYSIMLHAKSEECVEGTRRAGLPVHGVAYETAADPACIWKEERVKAVQVVQ